MIRRQPIFASVISAIIGLACIPVGQAHAQGMPGWDGPGGWSRGGGDRWGDPRDGGRAGGARTSAEPSKKISVDAWRAADAGDALGRGRIVIAADDGAEEEWKLPVYEAAVVDELARRGYDTATAADPGQIAQVGVSHETVVPEEAPHKPVSGEVSTTVSNRGTGFGMALALDFTKPKKAIVATRLDVRIRDKATGKVLWEGRAEGQSREGDVGLDNGAVAARLAAALFAKFPEGQIVPLASR
ncbi:DUF4136 domain-containing protein [Novosphingobium sp. FKTRR1]|uniref:DUF4136 domain-containing protein n=1 Tax=Novosphingobium sp. FKTRR1 TaxID=2879118 RepID=UPI001CEFDECA|nr:DUF4136 domain-containing protein [Novosphingobium sp. FKTRR1]